MLSEEKEALITPTFSFTSSVTWLDQSHVKRTISKYNDELDDFELL